MEGLLITYNIVPYDATFDAKYEVRRFLNRLSKEFKFLGKAKMLVAPSGLKGIIVVDLREYRDNIEILGEEKFKSRLKEEFETWIQNQDFLYVNKIRFLDFLVENSIEELIKVMEHYAKIIDDDWRLTLKTRGLIQDRSELIKKLARPIEQPVNLKDPKYVIHVEFLGELVGFYLEKND